MKKILVTGGAGFVGSHMVDALIEKGYRVQVLDSLEKQVHGTSKPPYLNPKASYHWGNVMNAPLLEKTLRGMDAVVYLAALVGVGQSMYDIERYVTQNTGAAAFFLETIARLPASRRPKKMVVASSMSIYGEGAYRCSRCGPVNADLRSKAALEARQWEFRCARCSSELQPAPTAESHRILPTSVYAITKRDHEELFLTLGRAYHVPATALRFFNIYGSRQALSNPYTGVMAIFCSRVLKGRVPLIFEDGRQSRDFIHVSDIVQACFLALENPKADYQVYNVGTGRRTSVLDVAEKIQTSLGKSTGVKIVERFREGDIRHCFADITQIQTELAFKPKISLDEGLRRLIPWVRTQKPKDLVVLATRALNQRGLAH